jgi:hypothetical protein
MLILPIKKKWFDMIVAGEKTEEYREIKPYYKSRFKNLFQMYPYSFIPTGSDTQEIMLRNGYSANAPYCIITASLAIKMGRCEWGAEKGKEYYVLRIHSVKV